MIGMIHLQLFGDHNHKKYRGCKGIRSKRSSRSNGSTRSCSETDWATGTAKKGATHMSGPFLRPIKLNVVRARLASGWMRRRACRLRSAGDFPASKSVVNPIDL